MDVPVALLTVTVIYALVKWLDQLTSKAGSTDNGIWSELKIPLAALIGVGVVCLMAQTDFAPQQQFFEHGLDSLNGWSQALVGVILGLGAVGLDTTFKTVRNVGANDV